MGIGYKSGTPPTNTTPTYNPHCVVLCSRQSPSMGDSTTSSARCSTDNDKSLLDRARRLRNGELIERIQSLQRKQTALKGTKDGLDKFKGTSLPELRSLADYPKFDQAVRAALRPKRGGLELLEYEAFREYIELGIAPPFEIANPASVDYDPLTASAEENDRSSRQAWQA